LEQCQTFPETELQSERAVVTGFPRRLRRSRERTTRHIRAASFFPERVRTPVDITIIMDGQFFFCAAFHGFPRRLRRLLQCAARYLRADSFFPERVRNRGYITLLTHIKSQSNISRLRKSWPLETDLKHPRASVFQAGALAGPHSRRL